MFAAVLLALGGMVQAQENPAPSPAAAAADAPAQTDMQKWIATMDAQWQAVLKRDVTDVHEAEVRKLMLQYLNMLEEAIGKASKASDLDGAVALRSEQKRFGDTQVFLEQDEAGDAAAVKQVRAEIRAQLEKLATDSALRAKALHVKYDQMLAQAQLQLTQRQRLDDALLVKARREEVAAAWLTPAVVAAVEKATPPAPAAGLRKPAAPPGNFVEHLNALAGGKSSTKPIQLEKKEVIATQAKFKPPVEILVEAKTDSTNLRLGYAANQIIFNWERNQGEFRIDGVDGQLRFEDHGDYSGIDKPVSVFSGVPGPILTVRSIKVKQLPPGTE